MKEIRTEDAVGYMLCHDLTRIVPGEVKDAAFRKGHIIRQEDIPMLLSMGKEHIFVWDAGEDMMHENDAAAVLCGLSMGAGLRPTEPKEGKIELIAERAGLLKVNTEAMYLVNSTPQMMIASRHGNTEVREGDKVAGTRIIPLVIEKEKMEALKARVEAFTGGEKIFSVLPFIHKKVGIVTTGSEVYKGIIEDKFTPVLLRKLSAFDFELIGHELSDDRAEMTSAAIMKLVEAGADMILCSGGMSVDPDDRTPLAIRNTGAEIVCYGAPVLPGAMFMLGYLARGERHIPILGLPGCVMYAGRTIFDLVLPRLMADERLCAEDFYRMGEGGLCLGCKPCTYPNCGFGK